MSTIKNDTLWLPDDELTPELAEFTRGVRAFADEKLAPHARTIDEQSTFRRAMVDELGAAGILGGPLPTAIGGSGWTPLQLALAHEELGAVCSNARGFCAVQTGLVTQTLAKNGDEAQRERWLKPLMRGEAIGCFALTEPNAGSDVASLTTQAVEQPDGSYRVTGQKHWVTNAGIADVMLLFATVDPKLKGKGITAFVIDTAREGLDRKPMEGVELGHRGSDHAVLTFDNMTVQKSEMLGPVGKGFGIALGGLASGRLSVAAGAVGIHRAALSAAVKFTTERQQFGQPLAQFQMVQERLADMLTSLHASRALVHRCANRRLHGTETHADVAMAKLQSTEAAATACDQAVMLHGARGYSSAFPVERLWRDIQALRIYEGTSMIQKGILARMLTT
ncbi:MAG: alkylation response protein AidB-like acyl-CoA dehydrogenase [Planctomycetota bacterium]|jgi:alkylation response protein AidB-like acyl-CoA dehydrogenase